ncbi:hypothetical protein E1264_17885 [Actinomadura sp. KC216]|uniref:hypothetical protein n=1 Tax=Actinomadura sp. KC216 TaxID=2530370 RepID=UPI00104E1182|nr:hypothetical protein [Actinomadura sp. KC216]TDB86469.1 hypothetical protein E1264_17885 [Actinomadura sp. KC216]
MSADVKAMCARLVDERLEELTSERWAAAFTAHLDELELLYGDDPAMTIYVERSRAQLAGREVTPC